MTPNPSPSAGSFPFLVVLGTLFAFWATISVFVATVAVDAAWDARDADDVSSVTITPTAAVATPEPTSEPRPATVPLAAEPLPASFDSGEPKQHLFFGLGCANGVLHLITTDERIFAETACPPSIEEVFVAPFRGEPVRVILAEGNLEIVTAEGDRLTFAVGRAWILRD